MARGRRKSGGRRGGNRMRLDWVVNEDTYGRDAQITVPIGTVSAAPLTYAPFIWQTEMFAAAIVRTRAAFPEGERQFVKSVVGYINFNTSAWAAGSAMDCMLRIVKKPQEFGSAGAVVDSNYSATDWAYANERFAWQKSLYDLYQPGTEYRNQVYVKATVNQYLEPDEALFLVYSNDGPGAGVALTFRPWLRTLMRAES